MMAMLRFYNSLYSHNIDKVDNVY